MAWTEKMVEDLKIMWKQGLTTGEIGKRLGVSKNSIVGKVHRLQLDARPSPIKKKEEIEIAEKKTAQTEVKKPQPEKAEKKPAAEKVAVKPVETTDESTVSKTTKTTVEKTVKPAKAEKEVSFAPKATAPTKTYNGNAKLTDLDNHTCRWPIGDPKDENFHFCGRKVRMGQTYCEEHATLAYVKPTAKK